MIEELRPYLVRRRERVKPKLAEFLGWLGRQKIHAGQGLRVHQTDAGTVISASPAPGFIGALRVSLIGKKFIRISPGFVNGQSPTIDGRALTESPAPQLAAGKEDKYWVFVEVKVQEKTERIDAENPEAIIMVADSQKETKDKLTGRHPVALIEGGRVYQLSYFSLNHAYRGEKHFFVPA
jgi:hypothetical protein